LTLTFFFMDADEKVYARYGGRDADGPDRRQSLDGLRHTMASVLDMHSRADRQFAPRRAEGTKFIRDVSAGRGFGRGCYHCHEVKEVLIEDAKKKGEWHRHQAWRYPLPDNLGLSLDVDRGNTVEGVAPDSLAAHAGLAKGDVLTALGGVPVHSIADAQYALDLAPASGKIAAVWKRDGKEHRAELMLPELWKRADISWRPSTLNLRPTLRLYGEDLTVAEKKKIGLDEKRLAFRQRDYVSPYLVKAGIRGGDIVLGVEGRAMEGDVADFLNQVRSDYLVGDRISVNVIRDGKRLDIPVVLP
jgi:membrane-associated protease RseP (regulator of RpoE activity)